ncbi:MAG TPA: hypothetical protein EYP31_03795 [Roseibacterium sp.]|nr:hypothetical protein [Roseibacterium sp.]
MADPVIAQLALVATLFLAIVVGFAFARLKADPKAGGYTPLRPDMAGRSGAGDWADMQNSKATRGISFALPCSLTLSAQTLSVFCTSIWFGVSNLPRLS